MVQNYIPESYKKIASDTAKAREQQNTGQTDSAGSYFNTGVEGKIGYASGGVEKITQTRVNPDTQESQTQVIFKRGGGNNSQAAVGLNQTPSSVEGVPISSGVAGKLEASQGLNPYEASNRNMSLRADVNYYAAAGSVFFREAQKRAIVEGIQYPRSEVGANYYGDMGKFGGFDSRIFNSSLVASKGFFDLAGKKGLIGLPQNPIQPLISFVGGKTPFRSPFNIVDTSKEQNNPFFLTTRGGVKKIVEFGKIGIKTGAFAYEYGQTPIRSPLKFIDTQKAEEGAFVFSQDKDIQAGAMWGGFAVASQVFPAATIVAGGLYGLNRGYETIKNFIKGSYESAGGTLVETSLLARDTSALFKNVYVGARAFPWSNLPSWNKGSRLNLLDTENSFFGKLDSSLTSQNSFWGRQLNPSLARDVAFQSVRSKLGLKEVPLSSYQVFPQSEAAPNRFFTDLKFAFNFKPISEVGAKEVLSGEKTFPMASSTAQIKARFQATKDESGFMKGITASTEILKGGISKLTGRAAKGLEGGGVNIVSEGRASLKFLGLDGGYTFNPFGNLFDFPTLTTFRSQKIIDIPKSVLNIPGFEAENLFQMSKSTEGAFFTTKRGMIGQGEYPSQLYFNEKLGKYMGEAGTREEQLVVGLNTEFGKLNILSKPAYITYYRGRLVPNYETTLLTSGEAAVIRSSGKGAELMNPVEARGFLGRTSSKSFASNPAYIFSNLGLSSSGKYQATGSSVVYPGRNYSSLTPSVSVSSSVPSSSPLSSRASSILSSSGGSSKGGSSVLSSSVASSYGSSSGSSSVASSYGSSSGSSSAASSYGSSSSSSSYYGSSYRGSSYGSSYVASSYYLRSSSSSYFRKGSSSKSKRYGSSSNKKGKTSKRKKGFYYVLGDLRSVNITEFQTSSIFKSNSREAAPPRLTASIKRTASKVFGGYGFGTIPTEQLRTKRIKYSKFSKVAI